MTPPDHDLGREIGAAVVKTLPPVAVWTLTLNNVLAAVSILYVVMQAAYLVWKWRGDVSRRASDKAAMDRLMRGPVAKVGDRAPRDVV